MTIAADILQALRRYGPTTARRVAAHTGLWHRQAYSNLARLVRLGLVEVIGEAEKPAWRPGRREKIYQLRETPQ